MKINLTNFWSKAVVELWESKCETFKVKDNAALVRKINMLLGSELIFDIFFHNIRSTNTLNGHRTKS